MEGGCGFQTVGLASAPRTCVLKNFSRAEDGFVVQRARVPRMVLLTGMVPHCSASWRAMSFRGGAT
eukprot:4055193-Pyramimonas_sp.AAC.1